MTSTRHFVSALLLAAALTGCSDDAPESPAAASTSAPPVRAVAGTLIIYDSFTWSSETGCVGTGGYDDIHAGTQVVITDSAGVPIALGKLDEGELEGRVPGVISDICRFTFSISQVPTGKGFYGVEVGHRGGVQYSEQEIFGALSLTVN